MSRTTFQNRKLDGSPRVMLGWWRPHYLDVRNSELPHDFGHPPPYHDGGNDVGVYHVDDDEYDFRETHCLILGTEVCWVQGYEDERRERQLARHAGCPPEARAR